MCSSTSSQSVTTSGRLMARAVRARGEIAGVEAERFGGGDEVRLVRAEEIEHRAMGRGSPIAAAAFGARPVSARKRSARAVSERTHASAEAQPGGVLNRIFRLIKNCQPSVKG
jgi:hypothetical protein